MKKIFFISLIFFSSFIFVFLISRPALANFESTKYGLEEVASNKTKIDASPNEVIGRVIGGALAFVSVIFFLLTIYGGILWMTARGNEQQTDKALKTITSAAIGLVIVLSSYVIVSFLFSTVSDASTRCENPILGIGRSCDSNDPEACSDLGSGVICNSITNSCVSGDDSLCGQSCGSQFECTSIDDCEPGTAVSNYCTGGASNVCCIPQ